MVKIAQIGGDDCICVCNNNYCARFTHGLQCHFCNLVDTTIKYRSVLRRKQEAQIAEAAAAAFKEALFDLARAK